MSFDDWFSKYLSSEVNNLTLPKINKTGKIKIIQDLEQRKPDDTIDLKQLPFGLTNTFTATATLVSRFYHPNGKEVMLLDLEANELKKYTFEPGDTIGILPKNSEKTVSTVLKQLKIENSDELIGLKNSDSKKQYLPSTSSLRQLLTNHVNFKSIPMKQTLVTLAEYTLDSQEKSALQFLSSKEGADAYKSVILDCGTNFYAVFTKVTSCCPPVEILIEILPRLLPRPYSVASSNLVNPSKIKIAFSVLPFEKEGLCTGMLRNEFSNADKASVNLYLRKSNGFRLPVDDEIPLILVGPGTGIAPFLGFLDHIKYKNNRRIVYLFTGFQYKENYFCMREVENHLESGFITKLFVSFSREVDGPKYVQDLIKENWKDIGSLLVNSQAYIYECGDFKKISETVYDAFTKVLANYMDVDIEDAKIKLDAIKAEGRYLQDIWY